MQTSTGEEIRTVAPDKCQNSLGFVAGNLTGGFSGTAIGFRTAPAPTEFRRMPSCRFAAS